jgi:hypothetical protein
MPPLPLSNDELWPSLCAELHTYKSCCGETICGGCAVDQFGADKKDGKSFDEGHSVEPIPSLLNFTSKKGS